MYYIHLLKFTNHFIGSRHVRRKMLLSLLRYWSYYYWCIQKLSWIKVLIKNVTQFYFIFGSAVMGCTWQKTAMQWFTKKLWEYSVKRGFRLQRCHTISLTIQKLMARTLRRLSCNYAPKMVSWNNAPRRLSWNKAHDTKVAVFSIFNIPH